MSWRRLVLFAVLLLFAGSVISAMTPREQRFGQSPGAQAPPASRPATVVEATLPSDREVRARRGDVVHLSVRAPSADVVEVPSLAVEGPVDAATPAELIFVADRAGRFRVRLRDAGEAIGTLRVAD